MWVAEDSGRVGQEMWVAEDSGQVGQEMWVAEDSGRVGREMWVAEDSGQVRREYVRLGPPPAGRQPLQWRHRRRRTVGT